MLVKPLSLRCSAMAAQANADNTHVNSLDEFNSAVLELHVLLCFPTQLFGLSDTV